MFRWVLAVVVTVAGLVVAVPAAAKPTADEMAAARKQMEAGVGFMQDPAGPRWDEAYLAFKKAYELSDSTNALLNLAVCAQKLELDGEAIAHYETLLKLEGKALDWRDRKQIKADLKVLTAAVVRVTFSVPVAVKVTDVRTPRQGKPLRNVYELAAGKHTLGIHPGEHRFTATAVDKLDEIWDVVLENGSKVEHAFEMRDVPPPPPVPVMIKTVLVNSEDLEESRPIPLYVLAPGLLTLAAGGVMGTFMVLSTIKADELDDARGVQPVAEQRKIRDDLVTYNLIADIGIGVTAAAAATTLILILTRPTVAAGGEDGAGTPGAVEITTPADPANETPKETPTEAPKAPAAPTSPPPKKTSMRFGVDWVLVPTAAPFGGGAMFSTRF